MRRSLPSDSGEIRRLIGLRARGFAAAANAAVALARVFRRPVRAAVVALLLVVLPFQSIAAVLLDLHGPAHVHLDAHEDHDHEHDHDEDDDHDHPHDAGHAHDAAHDHDHGPFDRHHHHPDDATVVMVDEGGGDERAAGWSATLCAAMPASPALECALSRRDRFLSGPDAHFRTRIPGLPDRPPRIASR